MQRSRGRALIVALVALLLAAGCAGGAGEPSGEIWLFAHPDDETLAAGAAIAEQAADGAAPTVVLATDGTATSVADGLGLADDEVVAARRAEARAALAAVGVDDVRFAGRTDGELTVAGVMALLADLADDRGQPPVVHGHSPADRYSHGGRCGHPDHCAVGVALLRAAEQGLIELGGLWRLGHHFDGPVAGECAQLDADGREAKEAMRDAYEHVDEDAGRYGIGGRSVPGAFDGLARRPECRDPADGLDLDALEALAPAG